MRVIEPTKTLALAIDHRYAFSTIARGVSIILDHGLAPTITAG